jgi:hypothetical protein
MRKKEFLFGTYFLRERKNNVLKTIFVLHL